MPAPINFGGQDWAPQNLGVKKNPNAGKGFAVIPNNTDSRGVQEVHAKSHLQLNKHKVGIDIHAKKLEEDNENLKVKKLEPKTCKAIQQARQAKEWSQADLAKAINEKPNVVTAYEAGKAIPNESILQRMEKALGVYLRGVKAGEPLAHKKTKVPADAAVPK